MGPAPLLQLFAEGENNSLCIQNSRGALQAKETQKSLWSCLNISERWPGFGSLITLSHERAENEGNGKEKGEKKKNFFSGQRDVTIYEPARELELK